MNHTHVRTADAIVAARLAAAARNEPLPASGSAPGTGASAVEIAAAISAGSPHADRFRSEIETAVHGMALALAAARPHPNDLWAAAAAAHYDRTVWFEQAVITGHPTHPLSRTRGGLTDDEIRAYAPEHAPRFDLALYRIPGLDESTFWLSFCGKTEQLPVHPWQATRYGLTDPDRVFTGAAPLMSLRTVSAGDLHIKLAVDLQLTSAIRHVSPAAVHNGRILSRELPALAAKYGITVVRERSAIAPGPDGQGQSHLAAIVRPAPHLLTKDHVVPLAALAEADSATGRPIAAALAGDDLDRWWQALVPVLMAPLRLLDRTGIALEAHGQNSLVICKGDRPDSLMYRDFGGIRLPRTGWPQLAGDLQTDDGPERTRKLIAALFPTTLTALVDALATWTGTDPGQWWAPVADAARQACAPGDLADAVLKADWPLKATTAMRLADNPTKDIWVTAPNPLAPL